MVVNVAAQAVAKAGTAGAKVAGKAAATTARTGAKAATAAGRAGARAGSRAGGAAARSAARGGAGAARAGARGADGSRRVAKGLRDVRPGGSRRPPRIPRGAGRGGGPQDEENPEEGGGNGSSRRSRRGRTGDPVTPVTGALRTAARVLNRVSRPIKGRRRRRRIRRLLDLTDPKEARRRRARRNRRLIQGIAAVFVLLMSCTTVVGVGSEGNAGPPPPGGEGVGYVEGIPYAEVFNSTASLGIDPRLVAAVAYVESHFAADVIDCRRPSEDGALGIMQFMPDTAREVGVDPCDPEEAIPGGARYLLDQHREFGSWELALAAYNSGPQSVRDHGGIPPFDETEAYVPAVLGKWQEYETAFPGGTVGSGGSEAPYGPLGETTRYTQSRMTTKTQRFVDTVVPIFGQGRDMHCWRAGTEGEHPKGRACDFIMQLPLNQMPTPQYLEHGWAFVNYCIEHADELQVRYVIWQKRIWQRGIGWKDYKRYPNGNLQQNHFDHVHVTIEE